MPEDIKAYDELSFDERANRRELRRAKKELRRKERSQLSMAQSVSKKREIKEYFSQEMEKLGATRRPDLSTSGDSRGGVYDISTTNYGDTENSTSINNDINEQGIDGLGATTPDDGGDGLPEGYEETSVILCQDGSPVSGTILFKPDAV